MLKTILNPDLYHGNNKKGPYFEGWYFKFSDKEYKNVFAIIPGIFKGIDNKGSHSFIQVLWGEEVYHEYIQYPEECFRAHDGIFSFRVDKSSFSGSEITLYIDGQNVKIKGHLTFKNVVKWPDSIINPGSMGFYNYLTFMECYSQVCIKDGEVEGLLEVNGKSIDFTGGKIYSEKNWGKSFPLTWTWIQSNCFYDRTASFSCSIGHVPFPTGSFHGFLSSFALGKSFFKFTTINRSKLIIEEKGRDLSLIFENRHYRLMVETCSKEDEFILCYGPDGNTMLPFVKETLTAEIDLELLDNKKNAILFKGKGYCAGIEYGKKK